MVPVLPVASLLHELILALLVFLAVRQLKEFELVPRVGSLVQMLILLDVLQGLECFVSSLLSTL